MAATRIQFLKPAGVKSAFFYTDRLARIGSEIDLFESCVTVANWLEYILLPFMISSVCPGSEQEELVVILLYERQLLR